MLSAGIVDPAKVVRVALQDAASIAGLMITTEAMVAETPKKKEALPCRAAAWAVWAAWTIDQLRYRARGRCHAAPEPTTRRRGRRRSFGRCHGAWRAREGSRPPPAKNSWETWRLNSMLCVRCLAMGFLLSKPGSTVNSNSPDCPPQGAHSIAGSLFHEKEQRGRPASNSAMRARSSKKARQSKANLPSRPAAGALIVLPSIIREAREFTKDDIQAATPLCPLDVDTGRPWPRDAPIAQ